MKKLIYLLPLVLMACAPGKKSTTTIVDIYCDSCYAKVSNEWKDGESHTIEIPFSGNIDNYKSISFNRFDSPNSCVRVIELTNYSTDTTRVYFIEGPDTIATEIGGLQGFCR